MDDLPLLERAYVRLRYYNDATGLDVMRRLVAMVLPAGWRTPYAAEKLVLAFCGHKIGEAGLRQDLRATPAQVAAYREAAYAQLRAVHRSTTDLLTPALQAADLMRRA